MPFQDIDETETTQIPRPPSTFERWLRKVFVEDWSLKLLALTITVVLWLAVTGQNKPVTLRVSGVQLNFLRPDGLDISNEPPQSVEVVLTGSPNKLDRIGPRDLVATVDVRDQKAGERVIRLSLDRVKMALPEGVKIQGFQPGAVPLRFEPRAEALVDVEVKLEGKLPEGYEVYAANAEPARVRLSGPSDRLNALQKAPTETILLDGRKESFTLSQVSINIADPKIDILDPTVDVHVEIGEKRVYKSFADVPLRFVNSEEALLPYIAAISRPYRARVPR